MKSRELRAKRAKLIENARELAAGKTFTASDAAKADRMLAAAGDLKEQIDRIERIEDEETALLEAAYQHNAGAVGLRVAGARDVDDAFTAYLRGRPRGADCAAARRHGSPLSGGPGHNPGHRRRLYSAAG